ncbi:EAL domain-containing protein [Lacticaseibacillus porcinae]|uniref:EAL domain-containing protein n=1 Tax=Lacticaseibacillus porcinae TaxID=1123687 RepID=UPI000F787456|nr:EAL domain-containing protein [Lacticaseibacillus porcinae]
MIRLFGQAQFSIANKKLSGYELFLREQKVPGGPWRLPENIAGIDPKLMTALLEQTLVALPAGLDFVAFNLDESQFVQSDYFDLLTHLAAELPFQLGIELTERHGDEAVEVTVDELIEAASHYQSSGLVVCLDDVGTGENVQSLVTALDPYVSEYKYALQNIRKQSTPEQLVSTVNYWRNRAKRLHKRFTLEGLESHEDRALIRQFLPDYVQGYYFGTPHQLVLVEELDPDLHDDASCM